MTSRSLKPRAHRFAYAGLDRVIHERARLGLLTCLVVHPKGLSFGTLKQLCRLTDGNLSRHLQVLKAAKLVEISKSHVRNRPQTLCRITLQGRKRHVNYLAIIERVILDAAAGIGNELESKSASALART